MGQTINLLRGGAARLARHAHNVKVAGSNPAPATNSDDPRGARSASLSRVKERTGEADNTGHLSRPSSEGSAGRGTYGFQPAASPFNFRPRGVAGKRPAGFLCFPRRAPLYL